MNVALAKTVTSKGGPEIIFGGRLGEYKYYDMDKVIASAMERYEERKKVH